MKFVSIALSGAELADLDLANLELFTESACATPVAAPPSRRRNATRVELRCKSGMGESTSAFTNSSNSSSSSSSSSFSDDSPWSGTHGWDSEGRLQVSRSSDPMSALVRYSSDAPPAVVLRSRSVMEAASLDSAASAAAAASTVRMKSVSMDEASLRAVGAVGLGSGRSKDDILLQRRRHPSTNMPSPSPRMEPNSALVRVEKKSQAFPLPLPPVDENAAAEKCRHQHRRHLSIDLRAAPAARFVVELMPWEIPASLRSLRGADGGSGAVTPPPASVPFKWEEAPGRPKPEAAGLGLALGSRRSFDHRPLRLPPRLVFQGDSTPKSKITTSPTSIFDVAAESISSSSSKCENLSPPALPAPSPAAPPYGKMRAFFAWLVCKKSTSSKNNVQDFDDDVADFDFHHPHFDLQDAQWSRKRRKSRMRVVPMKKSKRRSAAPSNSSNFPSPIAFPWFDSPLHPSQSHKRQWIRRIAATCNVIKRIVVPRRGRRMPHRPKKSHKLMYRPLLCRVDADSAAFACATS